MVDPSRLAVYLVVGVAVVVVNNFVVLRWFVREREEHRKRYPSTCHDEADKAILHGPLLPAIGAIIMSSLIVPVFEEYIFRWPVFMVVGEHGYVPAMALALLLSALFGWGHYKKKNGVSNIPRICILEYTLRGMTYCFAAILTQSLWPCIIGHVINNGRCDWALLRQRQTKENRPLA